MTAINSWENSTTIIVIWESPLTSDDVENCFLDIVKKLDEGQGKINILFKLNPSGGIPVNSPHLALKSGFMTHPKSGKVVVIGMGKLAQHLAGIATKLTGKEISFHPTEIEARDYIYQSLITGAT